MPATIGPTSAEHLRQLFLRLHAIMSAEHERNWIRGVRHIIAMLGERESDAGTESDRITEAWQVYRCMNAGSGSFSDFNVWREDFDERLSANEELDRVRDAIWRAFEAHPEASSGVLHAGA